MLSVINAFLKFVMYNSFGCKTLHICESVFRKYFVENVEVFCALILHIYYGVGYCVVYF